MSALNRPTPAEAKALPAGLDYSNKGPQRVFNGRRFRAEVEFLLPAKADEVSESDLIDWLEWEMGGGSISQDNPLYDGELSGVTVMRVDRTDQLSVTEWGPEDENRSRHGRTYCIWDEEGR